MEGLEPFKCLWEIVIRGGNNRLNGFRVILLFPPEVLESHPKEIQHIGIYLYRIPFHDIGKAFHCLLHEPFQGKAIVPAYEDMYNPQGGPSKAKGIPSTCGDNAHTKAPHQGIHLVGHADKGSSW